MDTDLTRRIVHVLYERPWIGGNLLAKAVDRPDFGKIHAEVSQLVLSGRAIAQGVGRARRYALATDAPCLEQEVMRTLAHGQRTISEIVDAITADPAAIKQKVRFMLRSGAITLLGSKRGSAYTLHNG